MGIVTGTAAGGIYGWFAEIITARGCGIAENETAVPGYTKTVVGGLTGGTVGGFLGHVIEDQPLPDESKEHRTTFIQYTND